MLTTVAIVPSAPVLVPELAGAAAAELTDLHDAALAAAATLPAHWLVLGVADADVEIGPEVAGTFAGYGVHVPVALAPGEHPLAGLPLAALIAGWLRGQVAPEAQARVICVADPGGAAGTGARLRAELDATEVPVGVLVVADGAHTLTPSAPGGHDPDAVVVQQALDDALAAGAAAELTELPAGIVGRAAFAALAGLLPQPRHTEQRYRGAPFGVGYFVGSWQP